MFSAIYCACHGYSSAPLARRLIHQRSVRSGPLVLGATPLKLPAPMVDRDRTVSRRSEPSSRTALMGEQPNPWDLLQPQDATSRHRTFIRRYRRRRLSLHPALSSEGSACCGDRRFRTRARSHHLGQLASVVTGSSSDELTSHGITLDCSSVGLPRY